MIRTEGTAMLKYGSSFLANLAYISGAYVKRSSIEATKRVFSNGYKKSMLYQSTTTDAIISKFSVVMLYSGSDS